MEPPVRRSQRLVRDKSAQATLPARPRQTTRVSASRSTSPEKPMKKPATENERGKPGTLQAMFAKQATKSNKRPASVLSASSHETNILADDPISDDDSYIPTTSTFSVVGQTARKRLKLQSRPTPDLLVSKPPVAAGHRFVKRHPPTEPQCRNRSESRPWAERFAPVSLDELAVHKRKVTDVRHWLESVMSGRLRSRLLILKGSAGTGKTTTIRLLAKELRCELLEWKNPTATGLGVVSFSAQFEEFMARGGKFSQLDLQHDSDDEQWSVKKSAAKTSDKPQEQKIILIEEFPNTFSRSSVALLAFRQAVLAYLAHNTPPLSSLRLQSPTLPITPVVMVISETLLTTSSALADSFTAHRLLGPDILHHPGTTIIEFNNIAPTILAKALNLVVQKEASQSGRRRTPGPQVLAKLGEVGDIRSAVSSLEFLCIKGDDEADWGNKVAFTKSKKSAKPQLTKEEAANLELITQREASLGIFHAVGKIVWNKRAEVPFKPMTTEAIAEEMPLHLVAAARPYKSEVSVNTLMDETGTDAGTFISAVHENYPMSCVPTGPTDENSSLDYISNCIEYLSSSDLMCPSWDIFFGGRGRSLYGGIKDTGSHVLRQDEMAFQVASRGVLFSLPSPVKRIPFSSTVKGVDAYRLYFPASIKLWRVKEDIEGTLDVWSRKLLQAGGIAAEMLPAKGIMAGAAAFHRSKLPPSRPLQSIKHSGKGPQSGSLSQHSATDESDNAGSTLLVLGSSARQELVLERLPFMAHIARARAFREGMQSGNAVAAYLRNLEKIVSFSTKHSTFNGDEADLAPEPDEEQAGIAENSEAWATDRPAEAGETVRKSKARIVTTGDSEVHGSTAQAELFLSYDDIEDD